MSPLRMGSARGAVVSAEALSAAATALAAAVDAGDEQLPGPAACPGRRGRREGRGAHGPRRRPHRGRAGRGDRERQVVPVQRPRRCRGRDGGDAATHDVHADGRRLGRRAGGRAARLAGGRPAPPRGPSWRPGRGRRGGPAGVDGRARPARPAGLRLAGGRAPHRGGAGPRARRPLRLGHRPAEVRRRPAARRLRRGPRHARGGDDGRAQPVGPPDARRGRAVQGRPRAAHGPGRCPSRDGARDVGQHRAGPRRAAAAPRQRGRRAHDVAGAPRR